MHPDIVISISLIIVISISLIAVAVFVWWFARASSPFGGWRKSAECQRCGHIIHGYDTPVWSPDKTCEKCGPHATWKRVYAKPAAFFGYIVKADPPNPHTGDK